jgi:hypothetical protein
MDPADRMMPDRSDEGRAISGDSGKPMKAVLSGLLQSCAAGSSLAGGATIGAGLIGDGLIGGWEGL